MLTKIPHQVRGTVEAAMDTVTCLETPRIVFLFKGIVHKKIRL